MKTMSSAIPGMKKAMEAVQSDTIDDLSPSPIREYKDWNNLQNKSDDQVDYQDIHDMEMPVGKTNDEAINMILEELKTLIR